MWFANLEEELAYKRSLQEAEDAKLAAIANRPKAKIPFKDKRQMLRNKVEQNKKLLRKNLVSNQTLLLLERLWEMGLLYPL